MDQEFHSRIYHRAEKYLKFEVLNWMIFRTIHENGDSWLSADFLKIWAATVLAWTTVTVSETSIVISWRHQIEQIHDTFFLFVALL